MSFVDRLRHRYRRLPARCRPPLEPDERIVAWADAAPAGAAPAGAAPEDGADGGGDTGMIVATNRGLWLPGVPARLAWHEINKATWAGRELTLVAARQVADADGYAVLADAPPVAYALVDPGRVPEQVRTRVTRSVAYTSHHPLPGGGGVRVVARRVGGRDGLRWAVRYDPGTSAGTGGGTGVDPGDLPGDVVAATAALVTRARAEVGVATY